MKRVLVIVPFPMSEENLAKRRAQMNAVKLGEGIAFDFRPVAFAPTGYVSQQDAVLADLGILEAGIEAEREGYDAVCIDTMSDSGMTALRSALSIPVIGPGRHAMAAALMLGERFSVLDVPVLGAGRTAMSYALTLGADFSVAAAPGLAHRMGKFVSEAGLAGHCAGVSGTGDFETDTVIDAGGTPPSGRAVLHADRVTVEMALAFLSLGLAHSKRATPTPGVLQADLVTRLAGGRPRP